MSYSCTVNNIHFDKVFINEVSKSTSKNVQFANGIPLQLSLTFKTICALPDTEELSTNMVRETYQTFFGVNISTSSISRMITDLKTLKLIEGIDNPFGSRRKSWIRLTAGGRKLQKLFIGTTSDWKDKPRTIVDRDFKYARSYKERSM